MTVADVCRVGTGAVSAAAGGHAFDAAVHKGDELTTSERLAGQWRVL